MRDNLSDIAFTPAVKAEQERLGSRDFCARLEKRGLFHRDVPENIAAFIASRDSFYFGTASADGRPYIQHRGGEPGFLKLLDPVTLAFAEYQGNRQYISLGNLSENDRAFLFLIDYPTRQRVKFWGRARVVEDDPDLFARLAFPPGPHPVQRAIHFSIEAFDVNCRQHITPRYTEAQVLSSLEKMQRKIDQLEAQLAEARAKGFVPSGQE